MSTANEGAGPFEGFVLGIETSCDDTACAVLDAEGRVLSSVVSSQLDVHRPFGGVVPEAASREHLRNWPAVSAAALQEAGVDWSDVGAVAATRGPGLVGSLLVGLSLGKAISYSLGVPFLAVHHLEGHLFSPLLGTDGASRSVPESMVGLVVSGGHTSLLAVDGPSGAVTSLAETRDDAIGEAFDKIGHRVGLPFPAGAEVDRLAELGDPAAQPFRVARIKSDELAFSYSGLKSQALRALGEIEAGNGHAVEAPADAPGDDGSWPQDVLDLLAGFRRAAVAQLIDRLDRLSDEMPVERLSVSGGVAANRLLRREVALWGERRGADVLLVPLRYCGDNAAMIAHAGLLRLRRGDTDDPRSADAESRIPFTASGRIP
ncbi:MAG: tRNA (adenosine(37)-N6)-threonylcarbamoyltransferase complex transferase subunit TsaD [Holophagales bacterium]|nr:tRNA (adenosine(37)-N6)-threonylcarbamoyltransferase complex transferase subunit TsaD [Holophagales bacterium]MYC10694.1 tRNA (adenosine(37)-N6)-threonylcarbamoyltransferase complex transferase subunit TsaD [Holophagales bacterium]